MNSRTCRALCLYTAALAFALIGKTALAQTGVPHLTKEVVTGPAQGNISDITPVGDRVFFVATDDRHGTELWVSDGSADGTYMVKNIADHALSSNPTFLTAFNDLLIFVADDQVQGIELWRTDGTEEGTFGLGDWAAGEKDSRFYEVTACDSFVVISCNTNYPSSSNRGVWVTNGQLDGTERILDSLSFEYPVSDGDVVFFSAYNSSVGHQVWMTDGTTEGTVAITSNSQWTDPRYLVPLGDEIILIADLAGVGRELWKCSITDGSTEFLKDILPGSQSSGIYNMTRHKDWVLFSASDQNTSKKQLWKTDGTYEGTQVLGSNYAESEGLSPDVFLSVGDEVWMFADPGAGFTTKLHATDGIDFWQIAGATSIVETKDIVAAGDGIYYRRYVASSADKLWAYDGQIEGPWQLMPAEDDLYPLLLTIAGDKLYFTAWTAETGRELWVLDNALFQSPPESQLWVWQ